MEGAVQQGNSPRQPFWFFPCMPPWIVHPARETTSSGPFNLKRHPTSCALDTPHPRSASHISKSSHWSFTCLITWPGDAPSPLGSSNFHLDPFDSHPHIAAPVTLCTSTTMPSLRDLLATAKYPTQYDADAAAAQRFVTSMVRGLTPLSLYHFAPVLHLS